MTTTMLSEWFLLKIDQYIAQIKALINELWQKLCHIFSIITSIAFLRLLFLLLKRFIAIIKSALKYFFISLPIPVLEFLYILHFARAFLRIVSFFSEINNKNSGEIIKLLLSVFKVFISLLMISLLIVATVYGGTPLFLLSLPVYGTLKTIFRVYSGTKCLISLMILIGTYYQREFVSKKRDNELEDHWLREQYKDNYYKHLPILLIGLSTTILLSVLSFMGFAGLGPVGFIIIIVLACSLLMIDIIKSIYDFHHSTKVPEPKIGSLDPKNSLIDDSYKDYYYRKCRVARLIEVSKPEDYKINRIYLLKEIVVKIFQLQTKLKNSTSRFNFFSENPKIQEKIEGLKQIASTMLTDNFLENIAIGHAVFNDLKKDYKNLNENDKTVIPKIAIEKFIKEAESSEGTILDELPHVRDRIRKKNISLSRLFYYHFSQKMSDCGDIYKAGEKLVEQEKELEKEKLVSGEIVSGRLSMAAG